MRKKTALRALGALALAALAIWAPFWAAGRPPGAAELIRPQREGWQGVLSLGVVETFRTGGSLASYAQKVARAFEKSHPGVLVSVRELGTVALREGIAQNTAPDMLLFGSGALENPQDALMPLEGRFPAVRSEFLQAATQGGALYALPVAAGGYAAIGSLEALRKAGAGEAQSWDERLSAFSGNAIQCPGRERTYPAAGLLSVTGGAALRFPQALPKSIAQARRDIAWPEFALEGRYACYLGTQYEISRMRALEAGGRVSGWEVLPYEGQPYTDQVLLVGVVKPAVAGRDPAASAGRSAAAGELAAFFLSGEMRPQLASTALLPLTPGEALYTGVPGMEALEAHYAEQTLVAPVFSQYQRIQQRGASLEEAQAYLDDLRREAEKGKLR